jgi:hypothetical protein
VPAELPHCPLFKIKKILEHELSERENICPLWNINYVSDAKQKVTGLSIFFFFSLGPRMPACQEFFFEKNTFVFFSHIAYALQVITGEVKRFHLLPSAPLPRYKSPWCPLAQGYFF